MNKQMADAYEAQVDELEAAQARIAELERWAAGLRTELDHACQEAGQARAELAGVRQAHAVEVDALRAELAAAQGKADVLRGDLAAVKAKAEAQAEAHQEQRKAAAQEATRQAERDNARKEAGQAREDAATLRGQVEAIKEQNAKLMQAIQTAKNDPEKPASKA